MVALKERCDATKALEAVLGSDPADVQALRRAHARADAAGVDSGLLAQGLAAAEAADKRKAEEERKAEEAAEEERTRTLIERQHKKTKKELDRLERLRDLPRDGGAAAAARRADDDSTVGVSGSPTVAPTITWTHRWTAR